MALVVEDGTGKTTSESYISVADADTYDSTWEALASWTAATTGEKETALRKATRYLDLRYHHQWNGRRFNDTQALDWPRTQMQDYDGFQIAAESVPGNLEDATAYLAGRVTEGDDLTPVNDNPGLKHHAYHNTTTGETKIYEGSPQSSNAKVYPLVEEKLKDLMVSGPMIWRA